MVESTGPKPGPQMSMEIESKRGPASWGQAGPRKGRRLRFSGGLGVDPAR
jgi:hypothetical protein